MIWNAKIINKLARILILMVEDSLPKKLSKTTKKEVSYSKADILPFISYIFIPIVFVTDISNRLSFAAILCIGSFILITVLSLLYNKREAEEVVKTSRFTFFFGMIYILVAGVAITTALGVFSETTLTNILVRNYVGTQELQNIMLLFSYFATAISFFHGGITFLATDAAGLLTKGKASIVLPHFIVIFSEVVLLYFMSTEVNGIISFSKLLIALLVLDIIWVTVYQRNRELVFIEWGHYNSITVFFLYIVLITPLSLMSFILLFVVTLLRSLCDYIIGWASFYGKYPLQEM